MPAPARQRRRWGRIASTRLVGLSAFVALLASTALRSPPVDADSANNGAFTDVAADSVHQPAINALAEAGVLEGTECGSGLFCPSQPLQRWTAAVWLVRAFDSAPASALSESRFADVDPTQWWAAHAERLADLGITRGCRQDPLRYCPTGTVTRAQAASFLARALDLGTGTSFGFVDIEGSDHAGAINALAAHKVIVGCGTEPARYCPDRPTSRAQMASLIARALRLVPLPAADPAEAGPSDPDDGIVADTSAQPGPGYTAVSSGSGHACGLRHRRHHRLLGLQPCWSDRCARGTVHHCQRRIRALVRDPHRRHRCLLGQQPLGPGRSARWTVQLRQRPLRAFVRDPHRQHHHLLGQQPLGPGRSPAGAFSAVSVGETH